MPSLQKRKQSPREKLANTLSAAIGLAGGLIALPFLIAEAGQPESKLTPAGALFFGASVLLLYLASTLYHAAAGSSLEEKLRKLDHCAIFVLIAGTYTPFALGSLRGPWGWTLFGAVWSLALAGILLKLIRCEDSRLSLAFYLGMGWIGICAAPLLLSRVPLPGLAWLLAGGCAYTAGVAFFAAKRLPFAHFIWHLFVLAGTACHFVAVLLYA